MEKMNFLRIVNFTDEANKVVNQAIYIAREEKCAEINIVHLFIALLKRCETGKKLLESLEISYDMVYSSYQTLAASHRYGTDTFTNENMLDNMSKDVFIILSTTTLECGLRNREVDTEDLMQATLYLNSNVLSDFVNYLGFDIEDLRNIKQSQYYIPDEIEFFAEDLNETLAKNRRSIENVEEYTDEIIEILSRKIKANVCLVGEAGTGKTSIVYGLAQRIIDGDVTNELKNKHIVYINSSLLTSGTRFRGDFEERMALLLDWASKTDTILFLDEIHTFVDLNKNGGSASTAGNMIKKYLSDGTIRIIGATTPKEFHEYIEKDKAFERRIQKVIVKEPTKAVTKEMIKHTISDFEEFHDIKITDEAIESAVELSSQYIKNKFLPDKAYTVIDQAAAHAKISNRKLINEDDILRIISKISGVSINKLNKTESQQLLNLESIIAKELIGQDEAVHTVCKAIRRSKARVHEENKPLASFLFVGPTGVGKTELCKVLSREVTFGDISLIKIDMSEYGEKYSTSKMIGSAPGYVGYGEGGQLTEKIKNNPYSLLLFDEIEKAHPDVFNIFLQMLDEGRLTDGSGETADLTNCIIVMTSNAGYGADGMQKRSIGFSEDANKSANDREKIALKALEETFKPEFLNRIDNIVIFDKLTEEQSFEITKLLLNKLADRVAKQGIRIKFSNSLIKHITDIGYSDKYGARNIRRAIQDTVEDIIADKIIADEMSANHSYSVSWTNNKVGVKETKV